jgi:hypothetical protein
MQENKVGLTHPDTFKTLFKIAQLFFRLVGRGVVFLSLDNLTDKDGYSMKTFISFLKREVRYLPIDLEKLDHLSQDAKDCLSDIDIVSLYKKEAESYNPRTEFILMLGCPNLSELKREESISLFICNRFGIIKNQA